MPSGPAVLDDADVDLAPSPASPSAAAQKVPALDDGDVQLANEPTQPQTAQPKLAASEDEAEPAAPQPKQPAAPPPTGAVGALPAVPQPQVDMQGGSLVQTALGTAPDTAAAKAPLPKTAADSGAGAATDEALDGMKQMSEAWGDDFSFNSKDAKVGLTKTINGLVGAFGSTLMGGSGKGIVDFPEEVQGLRALIGRAGPLAARALAGAVLGGYVSGKAARAIATGLGLDPDSQDLAEALGNIAGGAAGGHVAAGGVHLSGGGEAEPAVEAGLHPDFHAVPELEAGDVEEEPEEEKEEAKPKAKPEEPTHPAGKVTAIDQETELPIVDRSKPSAETEAAKPETKKGEVLPPEKSEAKELAKPEPKTIEGAPKPGDKNEETGRQITQPTSSLPEAQKLATAAAPDLKDKLAEVAKAVPGAEVDGVREEKDPERAKEKVEEQGQPVNTVSDLLAGRVAVDTPEAKEAVVAKLKDGNTILKDDDNFTDGDPKYGFRSEDLQVQLPNKSSAEIQVVPREIADAEKETHENYEQGRAAELEGRTEDAKAAQAANRKIHDTAMAKFDQRQATAEGLNRFLEKLATRIEMESHGQDILEKMDDAGESPSDVSDKFWADTYFKLPAAAQQRFTKMLKGVAGVEPGDAIAIRPDKSAIIAKDWQDVAKGLLPDKVGHLEGTQRGLVALMKAANDRVPESASANAPKQEKLDTGETKYRFGSTQANLPKDSEAHGAIVAAQNAIPEADLAGDGKDVDQPHATVRYGIKGDDVAGIRDYLKGLSPFEAKLGKTDVFPPSESSDGAAVVHAPIESKELQRINAEIKKHGEFKPSDFDYKPHVTVAYVKPEVADRYKGLDSTAGKSFRVDKIAISDRNGNKEEVPLLGKESKNPLTKGDNVEPEQPGAGKPAPVPHKPFSVFDNITRKRVSDEWYATAEEANRDYYMNFGHTHVGVQDTFHSGGPKAAQGSPPSPLARGNAVVLPDGRAATVDYSDSKLTKRARVTTVDGTKLQSVPIKDLTPVQVQPLKPKEPWVGFDLDKTLAHYDKFKGPLEIGKPIPAMINQLKQHLAAGDNVRILTARVSNDPDGKIERTIQAWLQKNVGMAVPVTDKKDEFMSRLYDDKAIQVVPNKGTIVGGGDNDQIRSDQGPSGGPKEEAGGLSTTGSPNAPAAANGGPATPVARGDADAKPAAAERAPAKPVNGSAVGTRKEEKAEPVREAVKPGLELRTYTAKVLKYAGDPRPKDTEVQALNRRQAETLLDQKHPGMRIENVGRKEPAVEPETVASSEPPKGWEEANEGGGELSERDAALRRDWRRNAADARGEIIPAASPNHSPGLSINPAAYAVLRNVFKLGHGEWNGLALDTASTEALRQNLYKATLAAGVPEARTGLMQLAALIRRALPRGGELVLIAGPSNPLVMPEEQFHAWQMRHALIRNSRLQDVVNEHPLTRHFAMMLASMGYGLDPVRIATETIAKAASGWLEANGADKEEVADLLQKYFSAVAANGKVAALPTIPTERESVQRAAAAAMELYEKGRQSKPSAPFRRKGLPDDSSGPAESLRNRSKGGAPETSSTIRGGFLDPELFKTLFPSVTERLKDWLVDDVKPGDKQKEMMRQTRGEMDRRVAMVADKLAPSRKGWMLRSRADSMAFWNAVEGGDLSTLPAKDQALAKLFRGGFDQMKAEIQQLKPEVLKDYIENYFPHIWEHPSIAHKIVAQVLTGRKPFAGRASFLKQRTIPTMQDGIDLGLTPKSWNPVDQFLTKYSEMAQFLMGHQTLDMMKSAGTAKFVAIGKKQPEGWRQLDDRIGTVTSRGDDGELVIRGYYYAPPDAAHAFNNFVSRGMAGRSTIYDTLAWVNNNMNALQLGISAFHATTTSVNAATSEIALGIKQLSQGKPIKAAGHMLSGAATVPSIIRTVVNGSRLMREYLEPGSYAKMEEEANAVAQAGGRIKQNTLELNPFAKFANAVRNGAIGEGLSAIPGAILHATVAPVMEYWVPRMKLGAFYDMAHNVLDQADKNNWEPARVRREMQKAWDSVDNRFGQIVYSNLFWHRAMLDALQLSTRSVGWNYGDVRELGGGAADTIKEASQVFQGKAPEVTDRMAFSFALPLYTALVGAILTYLWTGNKPDTWKDYFYPKRKDGTRVSIPGYMKDVVAFSEHPLDTVVNKMAPIWEMTGEAINNRDFSGTEIRHKDDPAVKQFVDVAKWAGHAIEPFALSSTQKLLANKGADASFDWHHPVESAKNIGKAIAKHPGDLVAGNLGFQPAPGYIQNSAALNMAHEYEAERPHGTRTQEQAEHSQAMHQVENMYRTHNVDKAAIQKLVQDGKLSQKEWFKAQMRSGRDPLVAAVTSLNAEQALNVYQAATPQERKSIAVMVQRKAVKAQVDPNLTQDQRREITNVYRKVFNLAPRSTPYPSLRGASGG